jgi:hypothetical protein
VTNFLVWHNNIYSNTNYQVNSSYAIELSYSNEGNYWGRTTCPVFIAGTDSSAANVVDTYPYRTLDGWLSESPADCVNPSANITAPASGTTLPTILYSITGSASDNVDVTNVNVTITGSGGSSVYVADYDNVSDIWNYTWDTSGELGGLYNITVNASDAGGNYNDTSEVINISVDKTDPVISSVSAGSISSSGATITWTTDENANSSVSYGTNASLLGSTATSATYQTSHSVALSSLSASTTYYYNVTSCDQLGNCQTEGPNNFTTSAASTGGGGGGGGGTVTTTSTFELGDLEGASMELRLGRGDSMTFTHGTADLHEIKVTSLGSSYANFEVMSEPQTFRLFIGQSSEVDIDADGEDDINVKLLDIIASKALVKVTSLVTDAEKIALLPPAKPKPRVVEEPKPEVIEEPAPPPKAEPTQPEPSAPEPTPVAAPEPEVVEEKGAGAYWAILGVILVVAVIILAAFTLRHKKNIKKKG